jgi:hypothetical protein
MTSAITDLRARLDIFERPQRHQPMPLVPPLLLNAFTPKESTKAWQRR